MIVPKIYTREDGSYQVKHSFHKIKFCNNKGELNQRILQAYMDEYKPSCLIEEEDNYLFLYLISEAEMLPELIEENAQRV